MAHGVYWVVMDFVQGNWTIRTVIGRLALGAAVRVGLISVSQPWIFASYAGTPTEVFPLTGLQTAGGSLYLFVLVNGALLYLGRVLAGDYLLLPVADKWLYLLGGIAALAAASQALRDPSFHYSVGFGLGFPLATGAAAAICVAAFLQRPQQKLGWSPLAAVMVVGLGVVYILGIVILFSLSPGII